MFIIRPAIVGWSYREPTPGWVDNISAAGAMVFFVGLGVVRDGIGDYHKIGDLIPCDFVWNATIIGTVFAANKNQLVVHNWGSSSINQITWGLFINTAAQYYTSVPFEQQLNAPRSHFVSSRRKYEMWYFLNSKIPEKIYSLLGKFSTNIKKNSDRLKKINQKGYMVNQLMAHFTTNDWIFDSPINAYLLSQMSPEDKSEFNIDISTITIQLVKKLNTIKYEHEIKLEKYASSHRMRN